jgi:endonuclease/exonuclease/phosphatase family metal-dependent hydrolase
VSGTTVGPATKGNRIDYVFLSRSTPAIRALRSWVEATGLSDHKAVRADLLIPPATAP